MGILKTYSEILMKTEESHAKGEEVATPLNISNVSREKVASYEKITEEREEESGTRPEEEVEDKQITTIIEESQQAITTGKAVLTILLAPILDFVFTTFNLLFRVITLLIGYSSL